MGKKPIGIFDSGYGGLTVLSEIQKELPQYDYIYLGDNARTPYGTRSFEVVYSYTLQAVEQLFSMGCELIIIACNTASAKALRTIQQNDLPKIDPGKRVLGVIRPSTEKVGEMTRSKHVGILGTEGTVRSGSYKIEINKFFPDVVVSQEACPIWVPLIESNQFDTEGGHFFVKQHLNNLLEQDPKIDTIILGCTHYPILKSVIEKYLPNDVKVISQGEIVSKSLADYLNRHPEIEVKCTKGGTVEYYTTERPDKFDINARLFVSNASIHSKHLPLGH